MIIIIVIENVYFAKNLKLFGVMLGICGKEMWVGGKMIIGQFKNTI
jgi:hypothetical protein